MNDKYSLESVPSDYLKRNFAWHVITHELGNIPSCFRNATMMFLRPQFHSSMGRNYIESMVRYFF